MKVKLLKKIRKKYTIIEVVDVPKNMEKDFTFFSYLCSHYETPFYVVKDEKSWVTTYVVGAQTLSECKSKLLKIIRNKYSNNRFNEKRVTYKTLWYKE